MLPSGPLVEFFPDGALRDALDALTRAGGGFYGEEGPSENRQEAEKASPSKMSSDAHSDPASTHHGKQSALHLPRLRLLGRHLEAKPCSSEALASVLPRCDMRALLAWGSCRLRVGVPADAWRSMLSFFRSATAHPPHGVPTIAG